MVRQGLGHQGIQRPGAVGCQCFDAIRAQGGQGRRQQARAEGRVLQGDVEGPGGGVPQDLADALLLGGPGGLGDPRLQGGPAPPFGPARLVGGRLRLPAGEAVVEVLHHPQQVGGVAPHPVGDEVVLVLVQLGEEADDPPQGGRVSQVLGQGRHQQAGAADAPRQTLRGGGGGEQALPDLGAEVPLGLCIDLAEEARCCAGNQGPAEQLLGDEGVLEGCAANLGVRVQQGGEQFFGLEGVAGPGQAAAMVQGGGLRGGDWLRGELRQGLPVRVVRWQGGQLLGGACGGHGPGQLLGQALGHGAEVRSQLGMEGFDSGFPLGLFRCGGLVQLSHLIKEGDHQLQVPPDGFGGGFVAGQGEEDGPVAEPVRCAGHEGEEAGRGQGAGQTLQQPQLGLGRQLGSNQGQVAEVQLVLFRERSQERGVP